MLKKYKCYSCGKDIEIIKPIDDETPGSFLSAFEYFSSNILSGKQALEETLRNDLMLPKESLYEAVRAMLDQITEGDYLLKKLINEEAKIENIQEKEGYFITIDRSNWVYHKK